MYSIGYAVLGVLYGKNTVVETLVTYSWVVVRCITYVGRLVKNEGAYYGKIG